MRRLSELLSVQQLHSFTKSTVNTRKRILLIIGHEQSFSAMFFRDPFETVLGFISQSLLRSVYLLFFFLLSINICIHPIRRNKIKRFEKKQQSISHEYNLPCKMS